jgi:hypothetical protein
MSLIGSLEDLGLGDILQIIGLSGKSGILTLRCEEGEGWIVFRGGLICSARIKDGPTDLRELLVSRQVVPEAQLEGLCQEARSRGLPLEPVVLEHTFLDADGLNALRREHIEHAVVALFHWHSGQFSFEMREADSEDESGETGLSRGGIQPQFIALEGARLEDETRAAAGGAVPADRAPDEERLPAVESSGASGDSERSAQPDSQKREEESTTPAVAPSPEAAPALAPPIVILDPDLAVLEWAKAALRSSFPRVHIFQHSELAIARIRQYLARSEIPLAVLSCDAPPDPVSGAQSCTDIAARLRAQVRRMQVVVLAAQGFDPEEAGPASLEAPRIVEKPAPHLLDGRRGKAQRDELATRLREALLELLSPQTQSEVHSS